MPILLCAEHGTNLDPDQKGKQSVVATDTYYGNQTETRYFPKAGVTTDASIKTINDLLDKRIGIRIFTTVGLDSGYYTDSIWEVNFSESYNSNGVTNSSSFKRIGYEMLGLAGYQNGYMRWMSTLTKNDVEGLQTITQNPTLTWEQYKKDRFKNVEDHINTNPYFDPKEVIELFTHMLNTKGVTGVKELKRVYFHTIKRVTDEFLDGTIYQASPRFYTVSTAEELLAKLSEEKGVHITLANNIDFSKVQAEGSTYGGRFMGFLDGNGYTISGLDKPLFNNIHFGVIRDLTLSGTSANKESLLSLT